MDCAKGINFLYSCGGRMQDYWGDGKATGPLLPMIAVPTTAGTGSETQSFALIADAETHVKMACGDKRAAFRVAILDPELTLTQPPRVTALTGIDALAHAVETYVTKRRNALSLAFSREAWRHLAPNFLRVLERAERSRPPAARCSWAPALPGWRSRIRCSAPAHALANPLTAEYDMAHGEAVALMLPHVVRHNAAAVDSAYAELWNAVDCRAVNRRMAHSLAAAQRWRSFLAESAAAAGLAATLRDQWRRARAACRSSPPTPPNNGPARSIPWH